VNLEEVYARYGGWIRGKARHYLPDAWEDVVQEVLAKLQPALERMRETREEAVRALVSRTVRSVCIDEFRRRARQPKANSSSAAADEAIEVDELEAPASSREEAEEQALLLARVAVVWSGLAERERQILALRFRDGLGFREIAELLDLPQGSVAGWYSRALDKLREVSP
jgi:RNA polymerase sigma factor (sigma-70 family)